MAVARIRACKLVAFQLLAFMALVSMCAMDLYKVLGIDKKADDKTIKKAYKKAAVCVIYFHALIIPPPVLNPVLLTGPSDFR